MTNPTATHLVVKQLHTIGHRAVRAVVEAKGAARELSPAHLRTAAEWLARGDRRAGVARRWPNLAARLSKLAVSWESGKLGGAQ